MNLIFQQQPQQQQQVNLYSLVPNDTFILNFYGSDERNSNEILFQFSNSNFSNNNSSNNNSNNNNNNSSNNSKLLWFNKSHQTPELPEQPEKKFGPAYWNGKFSIRIVLQLFPDGIEIASNLFIGF